ncbi:MAG: ABC transporter ATP-binding protein [Pseudomonadota bacterium]
MLLHADQLTKSYPGDAGPVTVLKGVSLSVAAGETLALTGESGSGKSTLLTLLAGLDTPDSGDIRLNGESLTGLPDAKLAAIRRDRVGLIFQQFNLIPSLSVAQNIAFQARLSGREDGAWIDHLTNTLGLGDHTAKYPETLSGGQQQRVAVGRTLASKPDVILADEPTGNLDETTGDTVLSTMLDLVAESGAALVMVTHSTRLAAKLQTRLHLSQGQLA